MHIGYTLDQVHVAERMLRARNFISYHPSRAMVSHTKNGIQLPRVSKPRFTWETKLKQLSDRGAPVGWTKLGAVGKRHFARKLILGVIQLEKRYENDDFLVESALDRLRDIRVDIRLALSELDRRNTHVSDNSTDDALSNRSRLSRHRKRVQNFISIIDGVMEGIRKGEYP